MFEKIRCYCYSKKNFLFLAFPIMAVLFFTACGSISNPDNGMAESVAGPVPMGETSVSGYVQNKITVNSSEQVAVVPDIAEIVYAVRTEAKDAASCQQQNTSDVNNVIGILKNMGISETDIQTTDYYMYPIYNYSGNTQRITGYEASTSLTVSNLPIDSLSDILAKSVEAGINNIQSIAYQSSQYDEAYANALKLAMESAKTKASALAEAGNCSLGNVVGVHENSNYSSARYTDNALSSKMRQAEQMALEDTAGAGIMPGEINIEVNITVDYLITTP
ncbi:MAG: SIMPL domain-containing protein [Lachnospiraceae bacterium]|jgi:hypothetical protein|nr:SIMPL domain-containing protein [Lachnospiraceae bacterium]